MNKVDYLLQRINWHKNSGKFFSNNLHPLLSYKHNHLLPPIYQEFYKKIGIGDIDSNPIIGEGYLIISITEPEFYYDHPDWNNDFDGYDMLDSSDKWFNSNQTSQRKDVLLLGKDVDRQWFGFDFKKNILVTQWDEPKYLEFKDIVDYVKFKIESNEVYNNINFQY